MIIRSIALGLSWATAVATPLLAPVAASAQQQTFQLDLPAQDMEGALKALAKATGQQVVFRSTTVRGKRSNALKGAYTADAAVAALIRGSGLAASRSPRGVLVIATAEPGQALTDFEPAQDAPVGADIVVTGTHIRGAAVASPVLQISQQQMREAGQHDLGDVIRDIPSNYNGGQNPGARYQTGLASNTNASGSSALNLRGLGPDATLTLLNGRRLAYDGTAQAIDISGIPMDAVASIQVVPDGASALYGSDAVAGVANVILKRDFDGLATSVRLGAATEGGAFEQGYDAVGGRRWGSGGVLVAVQYDRQNAVRSNQRSYTNYVVGPNTLLDATRHYGGLITAHQDLAGGVTLSIDALYSNRKSNGAEYSTPDFAATTRYSNKNYAISPTLTLGLPHGWSAALNAFVGGNDTHRFDDYIDKVSGFNDGGESFYKNFSYGAELDLEGRLFSLPGGDVRLALGGGYRHNRLKITGGSTDREGASGNYYGFGELSVPLVSQANAMPFLHELILSGAFRHEEYSRFGGVTTPKLGLVYAPSPDLDFKLSWGRSFKAPTLREQSEIFSVSLQRASSLGGTAYPAGATVLLTAGGNRDLDPERARTISVTAELHPRALSGLRLAVTYFDVDYTNRVVQPLQLSGRGILTNPVLAPYIDLAPTPAQQAALIARDATGLGNYIGVPYDPAKVVAIANGTLINAASQKIHGIDLTGRYIVPLPGGDVTVSGQASWLTSEQRNIAGAPSAKLAGVAFNPPRFRARGGVGGHFGAVTATIFANYIGHLLDRNFVPAVKGDDMTTFDFALLWKLPKHALLGGVEFSLSVQNITNARPPYLTPLDENAINYDSTNYSALGRFVSFTIRKTW